MKKKKYFRLAVASLAFVAITIVVLYLSLPSEIDTKVSSAYKALSQEERIAQGKYIFDVSGGCGCHQLENEAFMSGGRPVKTPFGLMYGGNLTPDKETGIGNWSDKDFLRAMKLGKSPDGQHYYPVFPYTSFQSMTTEDLLSLKAYLFSLPPVKKENKPAKLRFPFNMRIAVLGWKLLFFRERPIDAKTERGKYLAEAVSHCSECHTPRNIFGATKPKWHNAGSVEGAEGEPAPNITPDKETGIGNYSYDDFAWMMTMGFKADGEDIMGLMSEFIQFYEHTTDEDLHLMYNYLMSLPAIKNKVYKDDNQESID